MILIDDQLSKGKMQLAGLTCSVGRIHRSPPACFLGRPGECRARYRSTATSTEGCCCSSSGRLVAFPHFSELAFDLLSMAKLVSTDHTCLSITYMYIHKADFLATTEIYRNLQCKRPYHFWINIFCDAFLHVI